MAMFDTSGRDNTLERVDGTVLHVSRLPACSTTPHWTCSSDACSGTSWLYKKWQLHNHHYSTSDDGPKVLRMRSGILVFLRVPGRVELSDHGTSMHAMHTPFTPNLFRVHQYPLGLDTRF
jgi:hypothetical protein